MIINKEGYPSINIPIDSIFLKKESVTNWDGIYFIFDKKFKKQIPIYIGYAKNLNARLYSHFNGYSYNSKHFAHEMHIAFIIESESFKKVREIILNQWNIDFYDIEYFFIDIFQPKYNIMQSKKLAYDTNNLRYNAKTRW